MQKILALILSIGLMFNTMFGLLSQKYDVYENVRYGEAERDLVTVYVPKNAEKREYNGCILYIHGGAWTSGDKATYQPVIRDIAANHGYAAASINYRFLTAGVTMDDILADVNAAVSAIFDRAKAEGYTLDKMIVTGMSAGAHLALMYAYKTPSDAKIEPVAVCSQCAPTDFADPNFYADGMVFQNNYLQLVASVVGQDVTDEAIARYTAQYSPVTYAADAVPTLIAHGQKDNMVPYSNALRLDAALTENGVVHELIAYPNSGHTLLNDADCAERYTQAFYAYAAEYLG